MVIVVLIVFAKRGAHIPEGAAVRRGNKRNQVDRIVDIVDV